MQDKLRMDEAGNSFVVASAQAHAFQSHCNVKQIICIAEGEEGM